MEKMITMRTLKQNAFISFDGDIASWNNWRMLSSPQRLTA